MLKNRYKGAVRRATTPEQLGRILADAEWARDHWKELVDGCCTFHDHEKTAKCYQVWTDPAPNTVACQQYIGRG